MRDPDVIDVTSVIEELLNIDDCIAVSNRCAYPGNDNAANSRANNPIHSIDRTLRNNRGFVCAMADGSAEVEQTQSLGHCGVVNLGQPSDQPLICKPPKSQSTRRTISIKPRTPPKPAP